MDILKRLFLCVHCGVRCGVPVKAKFDNRFYQKDGGDKSKAGEKDKEVV